MNAQNKSANDAWTADCEAAKTPAADAYKILSTATRAKCLREFMATGIIRDINGRMTLTTRRPS